MSNKKYTVETAASIIKKLYKQILRRDPVGSDYILYGSPLTSGNRNIKTTIKHICISDEYMGHFVIPHTYVEALKTLYKRLINKKPDQQEINYLSEKFEKGLWEETVNYLINKMDYLMGDI